jgi:hypothetical protein
MPQQPDYGWGFGGYGEGIFGNAPIQSLPVGYYAAVITSQYQSSPQFLAWLTVLLQMLQDANDCLATFDYQFDLSLAVGNQLDLIGTIIGVGRTVGFQPSNSVSPVLDDNTYRLLLQAKQAANQWDGLVGSLQGIWRALFPGGRITILDGQNMSAVVILSGTFSSIIQDLISNGYIVPKPETVLYTYTFAPLPIFGFSATNGDFIAGFDAGHWT